MSTRKLSPMEIELLLVCIDGAKATSNLDVNDAETKLIFEAEDCLQKLKTNFDPAISNRLWNISKDPILTKDAQYVADGGGPCVITWFFDMMVTKVREAILKPNVSIRTPEPLPAKDVSFPTLASCFKQLSETLNVSPCDPVALQWAKVLVVQA